MPLGRERDRRDQIIDLTIKHVGRRDLYLQKSFAVVRRRAQIRGKQFALDAFENTRGAAVLAARTLDLSVAGREPRGALDADLRIGGVPVRVVACHLGLSAAERSEQVRRLLASFDTSRMPVILLGDINEWFVHGRALRALTSHFRRAPALHTFPTAWPLFALDRIWIHPGEWLVEVSAHRSALARRASDHYPLVARMRSPG